MLNNLGMLLLLSTSQLMNANKNAIVGFIVQLSELQEMMMIDVIYIHNVRILIVIKIGICILKLIRTKALSSMGKIGTGLEQCG